MCSALQGHMDDPMRQDALGFRPAPNQAPTAPAPDSFCSRLDRKLASRSSRGPLRLHGSSSPSLGRMGHLSKESSTAHRSAPTGGKRV